MGFQHLIILKTFDNVPIPQGFPATGYPVDWEAPIGKIWEWLEWSNRAIKCQKRKTPQTFICGVFYTAERGMPPQPTNLKFIEWLEYSKFTFMLEPRGLGFDYDGNIG